MQAPAEALSTGELGALTEDTTHGQLREHTHAWYALFWRSCWAGMMMLVESMFVLGVPYRLKRQKWMAQNH